MVTEKRKVRSFAVPSVASFRLADRPANPSWAQDPRLRRQSQQRKEKANPRTAEGRLLGLVLAFEDKVGKGTQGARVFGIAGAIDAGFGAASIVVSEAASAIQSTGIMDQRHEFFRPHGLEFFFFQDTSD